MYYKNFCKTLPATCVSGTALITRHPQTVGNATIGSTVKFECRTSTTTVLPGWNINGRDHRITDLPQGHSYDISLDSLIVSPVEGAMNNSIYYCFLGIYSSEGYTRIESSQARLIIIQPLVNDYSSKLTVCCMLAVIL